jgi:type I restriction enzyme S subunit
MSTVDEAIDAASKVVEVARRARKALLSDLLPDERARTEQWRSARLGEIAKVVHGGTPKTSNPAYWNGDIPWVRPIDITAATSNRITDTPKHISAEGLARSSASLLPSGSIIVSTRGTIGLIALNERPMATNQSCEGLIVDNTSLSDYVALWLGAHRNDLRSRASGTTIAGLAPTALRDVPILIPELDEQRRVVDIINAVDNEIDAAEAVAKHARALRSALLSDLLSGKHEIPASYDEVLELAA